MYLFIVSYPKCDLFIVSYPEYDLFIVSYPEYDLFIVSYPKINWLFSAPFNLFQLLTGTQCTNRFLQVVALMVQLCSGTWGELAVPPLCILILAFLIQCDEIFSPSVVNLINILENMHLLKGSPLKLLCRVKIHACDNYENL